MIYITSNFYNLAVQFIAYPSQVAVQFLFHGRLYYWCPVFSAENEMYIIFYKRLAHSS